MIYDELFADDEKEKESVEQSYDYERWLNEQAASRVRFIDELPLSSPREMSQQVLEKGYKGQDAQRRAMALMAYRHIRRLKRLFVEGVNREKIPPKQNTLLAGPTGCGKTYLVELLFRDVLKLPTVIVDITSFTESGYVGDDVKTILTRLVNASEDNSLLAECGVVCLDEFDKLAASTSNARFAGEGTTKDVSGYGVQRELLTMIHGAHVSVPTDYGYSQFGSRINIATHDLPFIACGAFSGMDLTLRGNSQRVGFRKGDRPEDGDSVRVVEEVEAFQRYGFLPELIGRFTRIVSFPALDSGTLFTILRENVLPQYVAEFEAEGIELEVAESALNFVVTKCVRRKTGARGLHSELAAAIEQAAFDTFGEASGRKVQILELNGRLESRVC